jgi:hypothetical protein
MVNKAARIRDKYTTIFLRIRAIFFELALANAFNKR